MYGRMAVLEPHFSLCRGHQNLEWTIQKVHSSLCSLGIQLRVNIIYEQHRVATRQLFLNQHFADLERDQGRPLLP